MRRKKGAKEENRVREGNKKRVNKDGRRKHEERKEMGVGEETRRKERK